MDYSNFAMFDTLAGVADLLSSQEGGKLSYRFCEFSGEVTTHKEKALEDIDILEATYSLERDYRWAKQPPAKGRVHDAIILAASRNSFHPIRDYLNSLKYDGKEERVQFLFSRYMGGVDSRLRREQSKKFMVSAVARVMTPGVKVDTMPVLIGKQGIGKSTIIKKLAVKKEWFQDTPLDLKNKDCYDAIKGAWFVEIAEMKSVLAASPEAVKAFLTGTHDTYRPAYARCKTRHARQCVFFGTSNYLHLGDTTGNRRYWPVVLENSPNLVKLDRDVHQLWAEAVALWKDGYPHWLDDESLLAEAEAEVKEFQFVDPWEELIATWGFTEFTVSQALERLGVAPEKQLKRDAMRLAKLLRVGGYTKKRKTVDGVKLTFWHKL
tara:strand:- start:877 stop:2013 length:1137 start_codon:yes stop_codon:yes gene_type:complete